VVELNSGTTGDQLLSIVQRIEKLHEEKHGIEDDVKDIYAEAKGNGFDTAMIRQVVKLRAQDPTKRAESDAILATYLAAIETAELNQKSRGGGLSIATRASARGLGKETGVAA
jgi:uncharacterized protein (UPF0335 family)